MDCGEGCGRRGPTPARVSLPHLASPSPRRLSSCFAEPGRPAPPLSGKEVAWISLQGRLVGAEEATSADAIRGGLGGDEAVAWELFSPIHRVVVVAAIAAASKRSRRIAQLQRSIEIRDELLLRMQQKLDNLCEPMNYFPDRIGKGISELSSQNNQIDADLKLANDASQNCCPRAPLRELNFESGIGPLCKNMPSVLHAGKDTTEVAYPKEIFNMGNSVIMEQEERRMSDLSDFNWSVTSSVDFQLSTLATEQEFYNLRKECEEKDLKIKELVAATSTIKLADSKRIMELEEVIKRKNTVISNLKKDMDVLEKQVVELTRLRRGSSVTSNDFSAALNSENSWPTPVMTTNILYDMSSTSPSSSDPESPVHSKDHHSRFLVEVVRNPPEGSLCTVNRSTDIPPKQKSITSIKEIQRTEISGTASSSRQRRLANSSEGVKKNGTAATRRANLFAKKRWS